MKPDGLDSYLGNYDYYVEKQREADAQETVEVNRTQVQKTKRKDRENRQEEKRKRQEKAIWKKKSVHWKRPSSGLTGNWAIRLSMKTRTKCVHWRKNGKRHKGGLTPCMRRGSALPMDKKLSGSDKLWDNDFMEISVISPLARSVFQ